MADIELITRRAKIAALEFYREAVLDPRCYIWSAICFTIAGDERSMKVAISSALKSKIGPLFEDELLIMQNNYSRLYMALLSTNWINSLNITMTKEALKNSFIANLVARGIKIDALKRIIAEYADEIAEIYGVQTIKKRF